MPAASMLHVRLVCMHRTPQVPQARCAPWASHLRLRGGAELGRRARGQQVAQQRRGQALQPLARAPGGQRAGLGRCQRGAPPRGRRRRARQQPRRRRRLILCAGVGITVSSQRCNVHLGGAVERACGYRAGRLSCWK